jgi:hypothetical protein
MKIRSGQRGLGLESLAISPKRYGLNLAPSPMGFGQGFFTGPLLSEERIGSAQISDLEPAVVRIASPSRRRKWFFQRPLVLPAVVGQSISLILFLVPFSKRTDLFPKK